jgi:hypothetical protein
MAPSQTSRKWSMRADAQDKFNRVRAAYRASKIYVCPTAKRVKIRKQTPRQLTGDDESEGNYSDWESEKDRNSESGEDEDEEERVAEASRSWCRPFSVLILATWSGTC